MIHGYVRSLRTSSGLSTTFSFHTCCYSKRPVPSPSTVPKVPRYTSPACLTTPFRSPRRSVFRYSTAPMYCSPLAVRVRLFPSLVPRGKSRTHSRQICFTRILLLVRSAVLYAKRSPHVSAKCCSDVPCVQKGAKTMRFLFSNENTSQRGSPQLTAFFIPLFFVFSLNGLFPTRGEGRAAGVPGV